MIYAELPEDQIYSMFAGLEESLGPEGWKDFEAESDRRDQARIEASILEDEPVSDTSGSETNLAMSLNRLFGGAVGPRDTTPWEEWGYVIYRTTYSDDDDWTLFKRRFEKIIGRYFIEAKGTFRIEEAKKLFALRWVEDPALFNNASPAQLASHYRSTQHPNGFDHTMFLAVTPDVVTSVLKSPLPWTVPYDRAGKLIPYVVAIDWSTETPQPLNVEDADIEEQGFRGYFNVAADSLVGDLFVFIADQSAAPYEIGTYIT
ncbi:uncharacterized protein GIQ15_06824 [Arthroderma uncinatum]|uniref:uncharacterized protein n=1 Tax=Arthroderma uncinatum TaxID=74035 RepID=UPI00144AEC6E|nr:uncharacterized protein GIQ15_06824 [Arthroderma uncinatum]KAF3479848.1 hypothetical protein GIQ15_06824 [Arthroderma uncinatum]